MKTARRASLELPPCWSRRPVPLWRQVVEAVAWQIDIGRLTAGAPLPSTRSLARQLGLSRTTVQTAYDELSSLGYLHGRVGDGSYVCAGAARVRRPIHERPQATLRDPDGLRLIVLLT